MLDIIWTTGKNRVLIETLWNVKKVEQQQRDPVQRGINRNIVECKELKKSGGWT